MKKYSIIICGLFFIGMMGCSESPSSSDNNYAAPSSSSVVTPETSSNSQASVWTFSYTYKRTMYTSGSYSRATIGNYVARVQVLPSGLWYACFYANGSNVGCDEDMTGSTFVNNDGDNVVSLTRSDGYFVYITDTWIHWGNKNKTNYNSWSKSSTLFKREPEREE
ncbi:MAG: hypothetical protein M0P13_08300 [Fibrobacteraceae bacterium]|nr:hypothetical protein [Fibrobacteraceae bacterium]